MRGLTALFLAVPLGASLALPQPTQTGGDTSSFNEQKVDANHQKNIDHDKKQGEEIAKEPVCSGSLQTANA